MFADGLPHPTHLNDWYMLGWPASLLVFLAVTASLIAMSVVLWRRASPKRNLAVLALCIVLFLVADYAIYLYGSRGENQHLWNHRRERWQPLLVDPERQQNAPEKPKE